MTPLTHLTVGTNIGYTDNLAASLLETVLPTAPGRSTGNLGAPPLPSMSAESPPML